MSLVALGAQVELPLEPASLVLAVAALVLAVAALVLPLVVASEPLPVRQVGTPSPWSGRMRQSPAAGSPADPVRLADPGREVDPGRSGPNPVVGNPWYSSVPHPLAVPPEGLPVAPDQVGRAIGKPWCSSARLPVARLSVGERPAVHPEARLAQGLQPLSLQLPAVSAAYPRCCPPLPRRIRSFRP